MYALALTVALASPTPQPGQRSHPAPLRWGEPMRTPPLIKPAWSRSFKPAREAPAVAFARTTDTIAVVADRLYGIDPRTGATLWKRADIQRPLAARGNYIVATRGAQTMLFSERGALVWTKSLCSAAPLVYAFTDKHLVTVCPSRIVVSSWSGASRITQHVDFAQYENVTIEPWTNRYAIISLPFSGAWSGTNRAVVDLERGTIVTTALGLEALSDDTSPAYIFEDLLAFYRLDKYAPVQVGRLNVETGDVPEVVTYAPDPQIYAIGDDVKATMGSAYVTGSRLYAGVGDGFYRYALSETPKSPELLATVAGQVVFGNDAAYTFIRHNDGTASIVRIGPLSGTPEIHELPSQRTLPKLPGFVESIYSVGMENLLLSQGNRVTVISLPQRQGLFAADVNIGFPAAYLASDSYPAIGFLDGTLYGFTLPHSGGR